MFSAVVNKLFKTKNITNIFVLLRIPVSVVLMLAMTEMSFYLYILTQAVVY